MESNAEIDSDKGELKSQIIKSIVENTNLMNDKNRIV